MHVANGVPLGCSLLLPVGTVNFVQTLKAVMSTCTSPTTKEVEKERMKNMENSTKGQVHGKKAAEKGLVFLGLRFNDFS